MLSLTAFAGGTNLLTLDVAQSGYTSKCDV